MGGIQDKATKRPHLVLGLDPGIASCGFCLLDMTNHQILEMGSHLFKAPQEDKTKTSLAVTRRNARSARRNTLRTKMRMKHCLALLADAGLVPEGADKIWLQSRPGDKPVLKLRASGLNRPLSDRELAQVLYSLCRHRGYIPHGEGHLGETDDTEGRKVLDAIKENCAAMAAGNFRTVGEMLHSRGGSRNKGGSYELCVYNSQIQDEARILLATQRMLGNPKATSELEDAYLACLVWEKKTAEHDARTYDLVGSCSYFPGEKRAADADVSSELCRAYERLGHLVIVHEDGSEQTLTSEQVERYLAVLFSVAPLRGNKDGKVTYGLIRKDLDISGKSVFKGVAQDREKDEVFVPKSWRRLRKHLPEPLLSRMIGDRELGDAICEALTFASSEASLVGCLEPLELSEEERETILGVPFAGKLFKGYGSRSLKALRLLLGAFEEPEIRTLKEAEEACGLLEHRISSQGIRSTLLPPYSTYDTTCRNPVVLRAMGRMRRIVNAIIRIHGVPDEIHIELGRELKMSSKEKSLVSRRQRENEAANKRWSATAAGILGRAPEEVPGRTVRKLALREEQGEKDAYTGSPIDIERLVRDDRYCEIDHVLPYSRTCDDSRANKVLVLSKSNQDKRERTPYEWMTSGEASAPDWDEYRARVMATVKNPRKRANLLNTDLAEEAVQERFLDRNLNDTRYMSVAVKNYLENCLLFPEDGHKRHVTAIAGGATGNLRWVWGLNFGEGNSKDRSDDRHHAVDAAVIAACSGGTVQAVAKASSRGRETFRQLRKSRLADTQPWPTFASDVLARREHVIPTRMADHGVTGRVFEDTLYQLEGFTEDKGRYPLVRAGGKTVKKGNVRIGQDGSARLVDGMAFLRLWLDPTARPNGKVKGKWYAEPVYYADIPAIRAGSYIPKACTIHVAKVNWEPIPEAALASKPITVFAGDILIVNNFIGRYQTMGISSCRLDIRSILDNKAPADGFPLTPSSWGKDTKVRVLQEDCLGRCYDNVVVNLKSSVFETR